MTEAMATSPEQMVVAFQHDYKIWNDESFQNRRPDDANAMKTAEQNYAALLKNIPNPTFMVSPSLMVPTLRTTRRVRKLSAKTSNNMRRLSPPNCQLSTIRPCMSTILSRRSKNGI